MRPQRLAGSGQPARLPHVFLLAGALHCTAEPSLVTTVLGSCVAVCLFDGRRRMSGINHFVLPSAGGDQADLRYGDVAIDQLAHAMRRLGSPIEELEAKIFGGGAVLPMHGSDDHGGDHVGTRNVEVAIARLAALGIPVVARRTGGTTGLSLRLFTESGEVLVRRVGPRPQTAVGGIADHRAIARISAAARPRPVETR